MREPLFERIDEVLRDWDKLPKSKNDLCEFVILAEKDMSADYGTNQECIGLSRNGNLLWCYLSGCSCAGVNQIKTIDSSFKCFEVEPTLTVIEFYNTYKVEPTERFYESY